MTQKELYNEVFLRSKEWKVAREKALIRDGRKCAVCSSTENLQVHHKSYGNMTIAELTDLDNLVTLCRDCHEQVHRFPKELREEFEKPEVQEAIREATDTVEKAIQSVACRFVAERNMVEWKSGRLGWADSKRPTDGSKSGADKTRAFFDLLLHGNCNMDVGTMIRRMFCLRDPWGLNFIMVDECRLYYQGRVPKSGKYLYFTPPEDGGDSDELQ